MTKKILILLLTCISFFSIFSCVIADSASNFQDLLVQLKEEGRIPETPGSIMKIGNFSDELARIGYYSWFPITEAENFVLSTKIQWESGTQHPNSAQAGCGVVFRADPKTNYHVMASVRLDGTVYITGVNQTGITKYGNNYYGLYSIEGSKDLTLVVNGMDAYVYLDGTLVMDRHSIPGYGKGVGPAILSGSNLNFGNRCTWSDTFLYTF